MNKYINKAVQHKLEKSGGKVLNSHGRMIKEAMAETKLEMTPRNPTIEAEEEVVVDRCVPEEMKMCQVAPYVEEH